MRSATSTPWRRCPTPVTRVSSVIGRLYRYRRQAEFSSLPSRVCEVRGSFIGERHGTFVMDCWIGWKLQAVPTRHQMASSCRAVPLWIIERYTSSHVWHRAKKQGARAFLSPLFFSQPPPLRTIPLSCFEHKLPEYLYWHCPSVELRPISDRTSVELWSSFDQSLIEPRSNSGRASAECQRKSASVRSVRIV